VKSFRSHFHLILPAFALLLLAFGTACKRQDMTHHEYMYVSAPETSLRDRVATMYNKMGTVHNGDRVDVLEHQRRFVRVRTDGGQEGWIEERSLVPQEIYDGFQKLAQDNANTPVQAKGTTRAELNMHLTPARDADHLYQLKDGEKVEVLKRATTDKNLVKPKPAPPATPAKSSKSKASTAAKSGAAASKPVVPPATQSSSTSAPPASSAGSVAATLPAKEQPKPAMEDWYLVRTSSGRAGWVLLRMVDLDVPLDIAQYAEGQRIIGYYVQNNVDEDGKPQPQYLVLLNEPKDGLPYDYNQIRVFTRNRAKHRYETAYREHNLEGYLPVRVGHQDFGGKEGDLPTFTIREKIDDGRIVDETYKLNGPIVRRVLSPDEEAAEKAKHQTALAARMKELSAKHTTAHKHKKQ
jgi:hypothetical protein